MSAMTERASRTIADIQSGTAEYAAKSVIQRIATAITSDGVAGFDEAAASTSSIVLAITASNVQRLVAHILDESGQSEEGHRLAASVQTECTEVVLETIRLLPRYLERYGVRADIAAYVAESAERRVSALVRQRLVELHEHVPCSSHEAFSHDSESDYLPAHVPC